MPDPFTPPAPDDARTPVSDAALASLGQRLGAAIVDGALKWGSLAPGLALLNAASEDAPESAARILAVVALIVPPLGVAVIQWALITRISQSIGKRLVGIHIRRRSGARIGFLHGVVLRSWSVCAAGVACNALTMGLLGNFIGLLDALPIFGPERRCVHDYLADTVVNDGPAPD